jgi:hypothetical protein
VVKYWESINEDDSAEDEGLLNIVVEDGGVDEFNA